jgi:hypothetical protein
MIAYDPHKWASFATCHKDTVFMQIEEAAGPINKAGF